MAFDGVQFKDTNLKVGACVCVWGGGMFGGRRC